MKIIAQLLAATLTFVAPLALAAHTPAGPSLVLFQNAPASPDDKPESRRFDPPTNFHQGILKSLKADGCAISTPLTAEALAEARLLVVVNSTRPYAPEELAAVESFVRQGGSLLVVVDEDRRHPRSREIHNPLLAPFGLSFTDDVPYVHNVGATVEPGAISPARREIPYSGGRSVSGGTPLGFVNDTDHAPYAASVELPGGGRVIAIGEAMAIGGMGTRDGARLSGVPRNPSKTTYWGKDTRAFITDVFAWLLSSRDR